MGLFTKKKKEVKKEVTPSLPNLPKLPDFPRLEDGGFDDSERVSQLPSFPSNSFGSKFSQNSIKEAVKGGEEDYEGDADEFDEDEKRMMQEPLTKPRTKEIGERNFKNDFSSRAAEPVFIRLDKFEEALRIFNKTKRKVEDIERTLEDIKRIKEKEEKEFQMWESEVRAMKDQIERINQDIFSKI